MDEVGGVLLLHGVRHQLLLGALRADDVLPVRDEALTHLSLSMQRQHDSRARMIIQHKKKEEEERPI